MNGIFSSPKPPTIPNTANVACSNAATTFQTKNAAAAKATKTGHAMIAGYLAGFSGTVVGFPLDSVKVWMQTATIGQNKFLDTSSSSHVAKCSKSAINTTSAGVSQSNNPVTRAFRTVRALYSGASGPLVTVGMVQSINFATYDATRRFLFRMQAKQQHRRDGDISKDGEDGNNDDREYLTRDSLFGVAVSGGVAGMVTAVITAPLLMIKINQQITGNMFRAAVRDTFVVKTVFGAAFIPHVFSESLGRAVYVTTYETSKRYLTARKEEEDASNPSNIVSLSLRERMACAAVSGIMCWAMFYPLDSLRNRMYHAEASLEQQQRQQQARYNQYNKHRNNNSNHRKNSMLRKIWDTVRIIRKERSFYRGFSISIIRAGPVAAAVLPVYDLTLERLSTSSN